MSLHPNAAPEHFQAVANDLRAFVCFLVNNQQKAMASRLMEMIDERPWMKATLAKSSWGKTMRKHALSNREHMATFVVREAWSHATTRPLDQTLIDLDAWLRHDDLMMEHASTIFQNMHVVEEIYQTTSRAEMENVLKQLQQFLGANILQILPNHMMKGIDELNKITTSTHPLQTMGLPAAQAYVDRKELHQSIAPPNDTSSSNKPRLM